MTKRNGETAFEEQGNWWSLAGDGRADLISVPFRRTNACSTYDQFIEPILHEVGVTLRPVKVPKPGLWLFRRVAANVGLKAGRI